MTIIRTRSVFASARAVVLVAAYATLLPAWAAGCAGGPDSWSDQPDGGGPADAATLDASGPDDGDADGVVCDPELIGDFVPQGEVPNDTWRTVTVPACQQTELFVVAAGGQALRLDLRGLTSPAQIAVFDALGAQVASGQVTDVQGGIDFTADTTGEYRVRISRDVAPTPGTYEVRLLCTDQCGLEATRYPIVLVVGAGGADAFGLLDYFFGVEANLQSYGYLPFAPDVSAMAHSEVRAQELAVAIDTILADTGAGKVHLIGHSQAGLDFRVLLGGLGYGDRVATATSVSTPHAGYRPGLSMGSVWFGMATDADYINGEFAALYPDDPAVPCFSWAAATCAAYDLACLARYDDEVVAAALATTYQTLLTAYFDDSQGGDNDGVVPVSAAQWGTFLGILPADHWDVVGQVPGQRLGFFDPLDHYLSEARRLRALELDLEL